MFKTVSSKVDFPGLEKGILAFWEEKGIFQQSLALRQDAPEFVFYDGPPFATGLPHYGHLLAGTIKDIVPRYQTMRGHYVERRFGWDCHGLPVEYEMEQQLGISGKREIEKMGVAAFNEKCRGIVLRYTKEWQSIVTRMGRWVDFEHDYKTMDLDYMESIWWVFRSLWDRDLIYLGHKILPYCPRCATPLSNFETNLGYREVDDPAITVRFRLIDHPDTYVLAWTTTPWTLPSNLALAVSPEVLYVKVAAGDQHFILAENKVGQFFGGNSNVHIEKQFVGSSLEGLRYEPLFPYFSEMKNAGAFRIACADFVTTEEGTGIVHIAPGFGEDDYSLGKKLGFPVICPVDDEGRFTDEVGDYSGRPVKETDPDIIARLKRDGLLQRRETVRHNYPHCWRCDTPLIYRAVETWFMRVEAIKDRLISSNRSVHWVPAHLRDGRFGKWLENARDWAISRNRYWGTPLPVWRSSDGQEIVCIGSLKELEEKSGKQILDLHKHYVDLITIPSSRGKGILKRVPEVLDCWFESGAMPYAQSHYPFQNQERFEKHFPADFVAEGLDQTRGWFYTLMVLSTALFDRPAFKNVIVNGLVLAEDGRKMSKRLKNYPDPKYILDTYGADALRLYMINSPVVRAEDLCFSEEGVKHSLRHLLIPWWNAYAFFVTYARIDGWQPKLSKNPLEILEGPTHDHLTSGAEDAAGVLLDRWIISSLENLVSQVISAMDAYDLQKAVRPLVSFIDNLTNWYIRRSRRRFWKSTDDLDKSNAYATLYHVLMRLCQVAAPFVPFISEAIYRNLRTADMPESVHLCDYPVAIDGVRDRSLEEQMDSIIRIVRLGRQLRTDYSLKIRQPLKRLNVLCEDAVVVDAVRQMRSILADELNVKEVAIANDDGELVQYRIQPDYRRLGPRLGRGVKQLATLLSDLDSQSIGRLLKGKALTFELAEKRVSITVDDLHIERIPRQGMAVAAEGSLVVALDTRVDEELMQEGMAREFINRVQRMRKDSGLEISDRIRVLYSGDAEVRASVKRYRDYVRSETLALELGHVSVAGDDFTPWELNGHETKIRIEKIGGGGH